MHKTSDSTVTEILARLKTFSIFASILAFGCKPPTAAYTPNLLLVSRMENELQVDLKPVQAQAQQALTDFFGSPDAPHWPTCLAENPELSSLSDPESLVRAAGPVARDGTSTERGTERGLYRKHCAQCHGMTGDGLGPAAALLSPYPRDFRRGSFKFKSTEAFAKPTLDDLVQTLERGVPGTSMPAMANLKLSRHYDDDIPVLARYVRFLAIRGEVERRLMMEAVPALDLDAGESLYDVALAEKDPDRFTQQTAVVEAIVQKVARSWIDPPTTPIALPDPLPATSDEKRVDQASDAFLESARRGRELFRGEIAACSQCHGRDGDGRGKLVDFDEWTKDWTIRAGIDPKDPAQWRPLKKLGLLKPVPSSARNLQWGVFHGGGSPQEIYRAIVNGIDGTPMPAAARLPSVKNGMTDEQIWDLVHFCQAIGHAPLRAALEVHSAAH